MPAKNARREVYGNESISSLKGADRVRRRPAVIFGSDGIEGCQHSFFEILSNAIDEAREGFGDVVHVACFEDHSIEIEDFGRGIPLDYNTSEGRYNWELIFCELYAGGKYRNIEGENYEFSLGLNGLGSCATQYSSEYMDVTVWRDGFKYFIHFEKGENRTGTPEGFVKTPSDRKKTGTLIRWRPDLDVFTDINIPQEYYSDTLNRQAVVNAGLQFILKIEQNGKFETTQYIYKNGISDYVESFLGENPISRVYRISAERRGRDREDKPEYKLKMEAAFGFTNNLQLVEYYHNSSWLEHGGAPDRAVKSAFVSATDACLKQAGKYQKNESRLSFQDISDSLVLVTNSFSTYTSYENQTKKSITNKFIQEAMTEFLRSSLEIYFIENKADAEKICEQLLINKRSREQAERARINIKKKLTSGLDITNRVQKFVDCRTRDFERRELYIVEGDSALGSCKQGRDAEFQAIIPVRGKILNCLKADFDKIFKNDIITDLLKVLGCGVEVTSRHSKDLASFDLSSLKWNKIIICTDADVDGFQIRTLILTMLYRLVPTLIEKGYVYIAESPLYEITSKGKSYFAYSDREKNEIIAGLSDKKCSIQRSKGLGENEPQMMWLTTMSPETRRLVRITWEDAEKTSEMFELLLGDNLAGRKEYIADNGPSYLDLADIS